MTNNLYVFLLLGFQEIIFDNLLTKKRKIHYPFKWIQLIESSNYSIAICGCLKQLLSSSGSFGFCQTFDRLFALKGLY